MATGSKTFNLALRVNDKEVTQTLNSVGKDLKSLRSYTRNLEEGTEKWHAANKKLAEVEKTYDGMKKKQREFINQTKESIETTEDQTSAMMEFGDNFGEAFSSLRSGDILGFRTAMMGVTAGIRSATSAGLAFLATPIGAGIAALTGIVLATREWAQYNEQAVIANRTTQQITQLSGDALDQARVRGKAIEKTFGTDFKESVSVAKNLVEAFGITYDEAFDKIENGLVRGGKENDEFLKSLKEYPRLFAQAGFTVEDFQRIVNTGIDLGIYDDKLPDAFKEFSISVLEQTTASKEALENAFGKKFTDEIFTNLTNGSATSKDALMLISAEAERIGLNSQQAQQLTADLFKGAGEDAGGALVIFEAVNAALNEQERALTPLEEGLQRVADANRRLEEAQNDALKSDKYAAFVGDIKVAWINFKAGFFEGMDSVLEGLVNVDTKFRRFVFQTVQYTKDAFTVGADADWDKLGAQFDKKQKELEKQAAAQRDAEKPKEETPTAPNGFGLKAQEEADKKAAEAAKLREARNKEVLAAESKRLEDLDNLRKEYEKRSEDRETDSASKKAELEMQRALEKAKSLKAGKDLLDQIEAEHQVVINEAKKKEEEAEVQRMRDFETKKLELENELELAKAETEAEKEEIRKEQELEKEEALYEKKLAKFEEEMAFLQLSEEEKNSVIEKLKEAHEKTVFGIQKKYTDKKIEEEKKLAELKKKLLNDSLNAAIDAAGSETKVGQALLIAKQFLAAKETAIQLGLFANKMALNVGEATGAAATGAAETAKVGFPQNIPLLIGFGVQIAGIISAVKNAAKAKSSVKVPSFFKGGDTSLFGMGYKDETGQEVAGKVHINEYVVPEVVRRDPEVPPILNYLEKKRKKKLGLYADGGDTGGELKTSSTSIPSGGSSSESRQIVLLESILDALGITGDIFFGFEAEQKRQEAEAKLNKIKERAKIKKK